MGSRLPLQNVIYKPHVWYAGEATDLINQKPTKLPINLVLVGFLEAYSAG